MKPFDRALIVFIALLLSVLIVVSVSRSNKLQSANTALMEQRESHGVDDSENTEKESLVVEQEPEKKPNQQSVPVPDPQEQLKTECEKRTGYTTTQYQAGWKQAFRQENNLSEAEFNNYISNVESTLQPVGSTCELDISYTITKDWIQVARRDSFLLESDSQMISPENLPRERSQETSGRAWLSTINLNDPLSFSDQNEVINYYRSENNLGSAQVDISKIDFKYFWDGTDIAGDGGEPYARLRGTVDESTNTCWTGSLGLVSKELIYREDACLMN